MKMTKTSNDIQKKMNSIRGEIEELQSRLANVENSLSHKKKSVHLDNANSLDEIKSLKNDRDLILELIEEKQSTLTDLQLDLVYSTAKENRENTISELITLAEIAERLEGQFRREVSELDKILSEKIAELVNIRLEWKRTASDFCNLADSSGLGKGFKESTAFTYSRNGKSDELNSEKLIDELEEKGANLDAVLSDSVLRSQYFNHQRSSRTLELNFREIIFSAMSQSNVYQLIEE